MHRNAFPPAGSSWRCRRIDLHEWLKAWSRLYGVLSSSAGLTGRSDGAQFERRVLLGVSGPATSSHRMFLRASPDVVFGAVHAVSGADLGAGCCCHKYMHHLYTYRG